MRIAIVTDAWKPQVNGVVQTLSKTRDELVASGHEVLMLTPAGRRTIPMPTYPEIRLSLFAGAGVRRDLERFEPHCVHIATEGPLGIAARGYCKRRGLPFTTAYHTQFPEYVRARFPIPIAWTNRLLLWFHGPAVRTMVPTPAVKSKLEARGFKNLVTWSRGVDTRLFRPDRPFRYSLPRPIWIYMGRVAVEKNIEAFLKLELPGSKVIIGDGPDRARLTAAYPGCHFLGYRFGDELARHLAGGDVFVFPSRTDTFGLVMLEAMACGLPVAALPVEGPVDVVEDGTTGALHDDLELACRAALGLNRETCRRFAEARSWRRSTAQFEAYLAPRILATASDQPASS
ncbi:MAG: glycosyltransferase family 1 protein [Woeseiaceae bacterium]|jgi:glycosyltransferase involved in cell wall biosynthesis|nr:glycosyltransferase family 1 protein [Woeseiaceae bacterium]